MKNSSNTLDDIGFYTLSEKRARRVAQFPRPALARCEILLTGRCNFRCPYCRSMGGKDLSFAEVIRTIDLWVLDNLSAIRFSGGEPTVWKDLEAAVRYAALYIPRVAISTNGSAPWELYQRLIDAGANDFSISLDACCAVDGKVMAGGVNVWDRLIDNIRRISAQTYVTIGTVLTEQNIGKIAEIVQFASSLGVADIRVIPAAQFGSKLVVPELSASLLEKHPILKWRWRSLREYQSVRGLEEKSSPKKCGIVLDDMSVMGGKHYPCIIYLREGGSPIGNVGPSMMEERRLWHEKHSPITDPICSKNCLDFCVQHNRQVEHYRE